MRQRVRATGLSRGKEAEIKVSTDRAPPHPEQVHAKTVARAFQKSRWRQTGAGRSPASGCRMNLGKGWERWSGGRISIRGSDQEAEQHRFPALPASARCSAPSHAYLITANTGPRGIDAGARCPLHARACSTVRGNRINNFSNHRLIAPTRPWCALAHGLAERHENRPNQSRLVSRPSLAPRRRNATVAARRHGTQ